MKIFLLLFVIVFTIDSFAIRIKSDVKDENGTRRIVTYYEDLYKKADSNGRGSKGSFAISFQKNPDGEVKYVLVVMLKNEIHNFVMRSNMIFTGEQKQVVLTLNEDVYVDSFNEFYDKVLG